VHVIFALTDRAATEKKLLAGWCCGLQYAHQFDARLSNQMIQSIAQAHQDWDATAAIPDSVAGTINAAIGMQKTTSINRSESNQCPRNPAISCCSNSEK